MWETVKPRHKSTRCYPVTQASSSAAKAFPVVITASFPSFSTGQLGRIEGIEVKSALLKGRET